MNIKDLKNILFILLLSLSLSQNATAGRWSDLVRVPEALARACAGRGAERFVQNGCEAFRARPFVEVGPNSLSCQRKAMVASHVFNGARRGDLRWRQLAALTELVQPNYFESHATQRSVRRQVQSISGVDVSHRLANKIKNETESIVIEEFHNIWDDIIYKHSGKKDLSIDEEVDFVFDYLKEHKTPIYFALYIGSPTLDEVMQHLFQYVYVFRYDEELGRYTVKPGFNDQGMPMGEAPRDGEAGVFFHVGIPHRIYNWLGNKRFIEKFNCENFGTGTPVSKLNLPALDLAHFMKHCFKLMAHESSDVTEPGRGEGEFLYPMSLYHFSFSPSYPTGGHEEFLGRKLDQAKFLEFISSDLHRHEYTSTSYAPLELGLTFPNAFHGPLGECAGVDFTLVKNGYKIKLKLDGYKNSSFAKSDLMPLDPINKSHDRDYTDWVFDEERTYLIIKKFDGKRFRNIEPREDEVKKFYAMIKRAVNTHLEVNFCLKTRWLLKKMGINQESLESGIMRDENALIFHENYQAWLREVNKRQRKR